MMHFIFTFVAGAKCLEHSLYKIISQMVGHKHIWQVDSRSNKGFVLICCEYV